MISRSNSCRFDISESGIRRWSMVDFVRMVKNRVRSLCHRTRIQDYRTLFHLVIDVELELVAVFFEVRLYLRIASGFERV